jgi:hypothetical protein
MFIFLFSYISMTLTKKINYKNHKTRRYRGGMMKALFKGMFSKGGPPPPPPPPPISADNVRLFNAIGLGWQIQPDSTDYEILNIAPDADDAAISRGYRTIANAIRPLTEAASSERREYLSLRILLRGKREKLLDPALRQEYNELLRLYPKAPRPPTPPPTPPGTPRGPPVPPPPVPPPPVPPPPVPPPVARGANVTFSGTQLPNPILKQSGPVPPPVLQTNVGQIILDFIENINRDLRNKGKRATQREIAVTQTITETAKKMLEYPESSNLENYLQVPLFFNEAAIAPLVLALNQTLQQKKGRFDREKPYDITANFQSPAGPNEDGKIVPRRFFSLMVLSSRMCTKYKLRSNPECDLFLRLNELFQDGNGANFNSIGIAGVLDNFIRTNSAVTSDYVKQIIDGERMYEIYRANYFQADREISKQLIKTRIDKWLRIVPLEDIIVDVAVSYLFNKYTNKERERLNKEASICEAVANFSEKIGKPNIVYPLLPPSAFSIEQNENVDFDKINEYLYNISPAAVKKKADKSHKKSLRKKGKLGRP